MELSTRMAEPLDSPTGFDNYGVLLLLNLLKRYEYVHYTCTLLLHIWCLVTAKSIYIPENVHLKALFVLEKLYKSRFSNGSLTGGHIWGLHTPGVTSGGLHLGGI